MSATVHLGRVLLGRYRVQRALGGGAHGKVFLAEDLARGSERVALKLVEGLVGGGDDEPGQATLRWFRHPNWAEILDAGRYAAYDWFQAVRYVEGPSLDRLQGPQPIAWVWRFLEDGARVLRALHGQGLIHYDVTPGNWLMEGEAAAPRFVLTDGGLAHAGPVHGFARGTPLYMAPEVTEDRRHDQRVDLYSLGLVAYRLATGSEPISGGAGDVLGRRRREPAPHARERRADLPDALDELIAALLAPDPNARIPDADDLLRRLRAVRPQVALVTPAEAVDAATGGALIGRDQAVQRFAGSVRALAQHLPPGSTSAPHAGSPHEAVLLVSGPPGSGGTRLVREFAARARREEIPVLFLAGREGAPDRRNPLRRLVDGMATLGLSPEALAAATPIAEREAAAASGEAESHTHVEARAIERFLTLVDETARRSPFVLIVEDLPELPHLAQEAVRVLSRHLLGRAERSTGTVLPPLLLVVDLGEEPAERLVNPDAVDPSHAVLTLPSLTPEEVGAMCVSRFPRLSLAPEDRVAVHATAEGRPSVVATLLAEAYRRGDLASDASTWQWNLKPLATYTPPRRLAPALHEALRAAGGPLRALLEQLALLEAEAAEPLVRALWAALAPGEIPETPLLSLREHAGVRRYALHTPPLRRVLLEETPAGQRAAHVRALRTALDAHPDPRTLVDAVSLRVEAGEIREALTVAHAQRAALSLDQRHALQALLRRMVERAPALLADVGHRAALADLLDRGPDALAVARSLAGSLTRTAADLPALILTARVIEEAQDFATVRALLESHTHVPDAPAELLAEVHIHLARVTFTLRQPTQALLPLARAKHLIKSLGRSKRNHPRLLVQYLKTAAKSKMESGRLATAAHYLERARRAAYVVRSRQLYSEVLNNLGVVRMANGRLPASQKLLERALSFRRALGDVAGSVRLLHNLGIAYLSSGLPAVAASRLHEAAGIAARHALVPLLLDCLRLLGSALDAQRSTGPALECYRRALRTAQRTGAAHRACRLAHDQGPLAAATGDYAACKEALQVAATAARRNTIQDARPLYYVASALVALSLGQRTSAIRSCGRAVRLARLLAPPERTLLGVLGALLTAYHPDGRLVLPKSLLTRPAHGQPHRAPYRAALQAERASRQAGKRNVSVIVPSVGATPVSTPAVDRRLLAEFQLAALQSRQSPTTPDIWNRLIDGIRSAGETQIFARAMALRSCGEASSSAGLRADYFSRSVAALPPDQSSLPRSLRGSPAEHGFALGSHTAAHKLTTLTCRTLADLHSSAHRILLASGRPQHQDPRRADALHRVLALTARMEAGAKLDELLETITRNTAEITGAQRACVVLSEPGSTPHMRVATSVTALGKSLETQDLSHTVIRRVMAARVPLLLHDAFGDEELLGRPSVTSLSLRSILCVPMLRNAQLYGVMYADSSSAAGSFDQTDLEVLSLFAEQAAAAIDASRLVEKLQTAYSDLRSMQERLVRSERLRVLGEVSSGVAHEFNNLLTAILARVQLMGLGSPDREQRTHLALIEKATLDAAGVVRRLQSFSREQRTGTFVPVPLSEVCTDAIEFLRPLWATRRRHGKPTINVRLQAQPGVAAQGNPTELREVVTNLLKNSIDALNERGGTVLLTAARTQEAATIRVQDDGPGIPPDVLPRVFDPFFTTKGDGGTGLGLCLSQRIAEQHGGELTIESPAGGGTTVTLTLPLTRATPAIPPDTKHGLPSRAGAPMARVLIVDDDADVLRPLCAYLERSGYAVVSAQDGGEALARLPASEPDVVLSDIGLPTMDGLELCRRLRAAHPNVPVVLMSGWASAVDPATAQSVGAFALLAKPFAMQQVTELLARLTRRD